MTHRNLDCLSLSPTPPLSFRPSPDERTFQDGVDFATVMPESYSLRRVEASLDVRRIEEFEPLTRQSSKRDDKIKIPISSKWPWLERPKALVSSLIGRKDSAVKDDSAAGLILGASDEEGLNLLTTRSSDKVDKSNAPLSYFGSDVLFDESSQASSKIVALWEDAPSNDTFYGDAMVAALKSAQARGELQDSVRDARFKRSLHASTNEREQFEAAVQLRQLYTKLD